MSSGALNGPDQRAQKLIAAYRRAGYAPIDPPVLQPAEPFLDLSGEDIRRRMFLTNDPLGRELCLRPDLTIPVSRAYLQSAEAGKPAGFCYLGTVFRHREGRAAEFIQAGIESFGRRDIAAADAEMLALGLEATTLYGVAAPTIRVGDAGLFAAFVAALDLAPAWKRRLIKDFNRKWSLAHDLDQARMDGGPDRCPLGSLRGRSAGQFFLLAHASHVLDRNFNAQVQSLGFAGVDDGDGAIGDQGRVFGRFRGRVLNIIFGALHRG